MSRPTRASIPRRNEDAVLQELASGAFNAWFGSWAKRALWWFLGTAAVTVAVTTWSVAAWATNYSRDVQAVEQRVTDLERAQQAQLQAMRDLTQAIDSLRVTIHERERLERERRRPLSESEP